MPASPGFVAVAGGAVVAVEGREQNLNNTAATQETSSDSPSPSYVPFRSDSPTPGVLQAVDSGVHSLLEALPGASLEGLWSGAKVLDATVITEAVKRLEASGSVTVEPSLQVFEGSQHQHEAGLLSDSNDALPPSAAWLV